LVPNTGSGVYITKIGYYGLLGDGPKSIDLEVEVEVAWLASVNLRPEFHPENHVPRLCNILKVAI